MKLPVTVTVAALLSGNAIAQQEPPGSPTTPGPAMQNPATSPPAPSTVDIGALFDKLDTNHDGKLTPDEAQAHPTVAAHFESADTNHDGVLTKDEFLAAFKPAQ